VDVDDDSQISLPVLLDGKVTVRVRMDTGSYRTIIPSDAADQLFPLGASTDVGGDVNGNYDTVNMLLSKLSIGNIEEPDIVVTHIEEATEALLGMDILSRFRLTLDLSEKTLFLERAKNYPQRKRVPAGDLLLFSTKEDYPVVTAVNPGSAADKAGVQKGDMVLEVDGIDLKKRPASEVRTLVTGYAEEETRLRIRRNGSEEQIIRYKRTSLFSPLAPVGLGINLRRKEEGLLFKFISIASPAQKVGLRVGDQIIEVNGLPVATTPMEEISRAVKQPEGTEVILKIRRKGVEKLLEFKLKVSKLN
jgi:predicted metalloprotease with PDZ domain